MTIVSAQDIFDLNQRKEYTLTASSMLEKVLTDNRICSQAAKLWQYLFNKSKYDSDLAGILGERIFRHLYGLRYPIAANFYLVSSKKCQKIQFYNPL